MLDARSIAVQGLGFGARHVALQGLVLGGAMPPLPGPDTAGGGGRSRAGLARSRVPAVGGLGVPLEVLRQDDEEVFLIIAAALVGGVTALPDDEVVIGEVLRRLLH